MIRRLAVLLAVLATPVAAQETVRDSARAEAIRSRGFIRGAETQLTKVLDLIERIETHPDGTVDTIYASDLVPDSAPPEWRLPDAVPDSTSPPWVGDGRRLYTHWAWGDSSVAWASAGGDTIQMTWRIPTNDYVRHIWPTFQREDDNLWVPTGDGWRRVRVHESRPWICMTDGEADGYSFTEKIIAAGIALGLKVADWTVGVDSMFAQGLDRVPPDCPPEESVATDPGDLPMPASVTLAGYVEGEDNGLLIQWTAAPAGTDSVIVTGGPNGPGATFRRALIGTAREWRQPLAYDTVTSVWSCVRYKEAADAGPNRCNSFNWAPM